jgi:hypothetical protein
MAMSAVSKVSARVCATCANFAERLSIAELAVVTAASELAGVAGATEELHCLHVYIKRRQMMRFYQEEWGAHRAHSCPLR